MTPKAKTDSKKPVKAKAEPPESVHKLAKVVPITWRSMFGGFGIYCEEILFGIVSSKERELYFRIDETNKPDYENALPKNASKPFQPHSRVKGREHTFITMPYWMVPEKVLEKPATLRKWAEKALEAARMARIARAKRGTKTSSRRAPPPSRF